MLLLAAACLMNMQEPLEWEQGFCEKRLALIDHFNYRWNQRAVEWLPFPGTIQNRH
jgi:hypothetical protein